MPGYGLVRVVDFLICSRWSLDGYAVDVGDGDMRDFSLQDVSGELPLTYLPLDSLLTFSHFLYSLFSYS
jgi:hypothetical protein